MAGSTKRLLLVDSSIYIDMLRAGRNPVNELRSAMEQGCVLTCGIIVLEVLRGVMNKRVHAWMEALFREMTTCPLDERLWNHAAELAWGLDRRGMMLPVPDLAIASCALRAGATVVSRDPHFRMVPKLVILESFPSATESA
jgi:predicted nucleic acid-binding protein